MKITVRYALAPVFTVAFAVTAQAQSTTNLSDAVTTGSATTVVSFAPTPAAPGAGPAGGPAGPAAAAAPAATQALGAAATATTTQLSTGTMTSTTGAPIAPAAQATVLTVMTTPSVAAVQQLSTALGGSPAAVQLAQSLQGLLGGAVALAANDAVLSHPVMLATLESMFAAVAPDLEALTEARDEFNDLVRSSSQEFLMDPPDEFLAIHATLVQLIDSVNRAVVS